MSCCALRHNFSYTVQLDPGYFVQGVFIGEVVTVTIHPAQAILLVTIRPA
jgi:hypothetical protein